MLILSFLKKHGKITQRNKQLQAKTFYTFILFTIFLPTFVLGNKFIIVNRA